MREIKFRAWNTDERVMDYFYPIEENSHHFFHEPEYVMQYTGLKDKNGKEIYEGDIVRRYDNIGEVRFGTGFDVDGAIADTPGFGFWNGVFLGCLWDSDCLEVIGNCFEHPHLLESKDERQK